VGDGAGQPIPRPKRLSHEDEAGGGVDWPDGWSVGVGEARGDVGDGAGQPRPRPSNPSHEEVGAGEGEDGFCDGFAGVLLDAGQPIPRPKRLSHDEAGGDADWLDGWSVGVGDEGGDVGDGAGQPIPRPKRLSHDDEAGGGADSLDGWSVGVGEAGGDVDDGAGQSRPRPSSPSHEDVGAVVDCAEDAGEEVVCGDEQPRPNNPSQDEVGVEDADWWVDEGGRTDEVDCVEEPPKPRPLMAPSRAPLRPPLRPPGGGYVELTGRQGATNQGHCFEGSCA